MGILQIEMPDEELADIKRDAAFLRYESLSKYLLTLAQMNHDSLLGYSDENPSPRQKAREERMLLASLNDDRPLIKVTPEFWEQLRAEIDAKIKAKFNNDD